MKLEELKSILEGRDKLKRLSLKEISLEDADLSGMDLRNIDFSWATFDNCVFDNADFSYSSLEDSFFPGTSCKGTKFYKSNLGAANMRDCDLTGADLRGAYIYAALFEGVNLTDVKTDDETSNFKLRPPEKGAFIGYKKCFNDRLVTLYIPEDAIRTSATMKSCRTDKAKVVSITSFDGKVRYNDAVSLVDENFIYETGKMMYAKNFNPDRWRDSTGGIHFWMTVAEALAY